MADVIEVKITATDQTSAGIQNVQKSAEGLKGTMKSVGTTMAGVLGADIAAKAGEAFGEFVTDSVKQASDLNESLNAVNVTFGSSAKQITDWGKNNAASFGLSQSAFNSLATPLGAMLKNTGLSMQDTTKWTIDLTKRAADMASVFNTSVPEAMEAIQAGLRGEADPLEKFGVGLSAAKVQAEALAENAGKTANQLTTQELATARLNIIMKQTSQTQGDFANTSDGAANAARVASAQFDNAKASLGTALLPILGKAAVAAGTLAGAFAGLPGPLQATVVILGTVGTAAVLLVPKFAAAKAAMMEMGAASNITSGQVAGWGKTVGVLAGVAIAAEGVSAVFGRSANQINTVEKALKDYAATGKETAGITTDLGDTFVNLDRNGLQGATNSAERFLEGITGLVGLDKIGNTVHNSAAQIHELDQAMASLVGSGKADEAAKQFEALTAKAKEQGYSIDDIKATFPQYEDALIGAASQNESTATSAEKLTSSIKSQNEAADKAANALLGERGAVRNLESAYDDATDTIKKNGKTTDEGTVKGRANAAALDNIVTSAYAASSAITKAGGSQASANAVLSTARTRFIQAAEAAGMNADKAQTLANKLFAIPKAVSSTVTVNTATATARLDALRAKLFAIQGLTASVNAGTYGQGLGVYKATGGIVGSAATGGARGNRVLVGEQGPEIVDLAPGSTVHSNPDSQRMMTGSGGGVVQLEIIGGNTAGLESFVGEMIRRFVRVRGGNTQTVLGA